MGDIRAESHNNTACSALDVHIIDIDSYMAAPIALDCKLKVPYNIFEEPIKQVPVIRIFGATKSKQRICLHIHQAWPYMYICYDGPHDMRAMREFGYQLGLSLNHALNIALKSNGILFVAAVIPVKGVPFYGYHVGYRPFLKILFSNPKVVSRASSLLASGAVMGRKLDTFEAHLPYTLQFLVDYNLYGMGWIHLDKVLFRSPLPNGSSNSTCNLPLITDSTVASKHRWIPRGMPSYLCNPPPPERICRSELEADASVPDIINRRQIPERRIHHKIDESEFKSQTERLVHSLSTIWADEDGRRVCRGMPSLHSLSNQAQHETVQTESTANSCALPDKPAASQTTASLQWPNHWWAQSILQSMLASDREVGCGEQRDIDAWLYPWPTCREVDIGNVPLLTAGSAGLTRFYISNTESVASSQYSGVSDAAHGSVSSQDAGPVVVDVGLITKDKSIERVVRIDQCNGKNTENYDYSSDSFAVDSDSGSMDCGEMLDLDEVWMAEEISRVERGTLSVNDIAFTEIPQFDGANDAPEDGPEKGKLKEPTRQRRGILGSKSKVRKLRPLTLYSSKESTTASSSDDGSSSSKGRTTCRSKSQRSSAGLFELADKSGGDALLAHKINACMFSKTRRCIQSTDNSAFAFGQTISSKGTSSRRQRSSGIYIDIPHPEGSAICACQEGVYTDYRESNGVVSESKLTISAEKSMLDAEGSNQTIDLDMGPGVGGTLSKVWYSASNSCRLRNDNITNRNRHQPDEHQDSGAQSLDLKQCLFRSKGCFTYKPMPPSVKKLQASFSKYSVAEHVAQRPYFSDRQEMSKMEKAYLGSAIRGSSNYAYHLPIFDPMCAKGNSDRSSSAFYSNGVLQTDGFLSPVTKRRYMMWSHAAIQQTSIPTMSASCVRFGCFNHADPCLGWWVFSQRAPSFVKKQSAHKMLGSTSILSGGGSETPHRNNIATTQTLVSRRKRDQSDIKWNSVLGNLLPLQNGHQIENRGINALALPTKASASDIVQNKPQRNINLVGQSGDTILSQLSMELLARCHEDAPQNPQRNMIVCIAACFSATSSSSSSFGYQTILWTCAPATKFTRLGLPSRVEHVHYEAELEMIKDVANRICRLDPDIICGYEIENSSWGYLVERSQTVYGIDLSSALSRISRTNSTYNRQQSRENGKGGSWSYQQHIEINIAGRHTLNLWKIMRSELSLTSYTLENVVQKVLGEKRPRYTPMRLSAWLLEGPAVARIRVLQHLCYRAAAVLRILDKANIVGRAAEFASVIGIDFLSVLTRGSQFRVESLMARIAHPELFILSSPTRDQVAQQRAAECLPLVLEPKSQYYTDPVVVLDFQSLYPSIMIAYNYCFSTCLGSLDSAAGFDFASTGSEGIDRRIGFTSMTVPPGLLSTLGHQNINVSPNGILFVKSSVRKGLLGRMLEEVLESRVMLKESINLWSKDDEALHKKLDAWQLGLKLIANVTYGYTGASFSGRMPCVDVADAIVQTGRETLENAIRLIKSKHSVWGAEVVYGDTDSMFIHFPGKSRQTAFQLGHEIADAVTKLNPRPVKLKFENVYQPCVLLTKKRYAGWMYASSDQIEPQLDVKGMELIRRDGCRIQQSILEGAMDILFRENDLSLVKSFIKAQINKILRDDVPVEEFIITKEVRLRTYSGRTLPAHAKVARDMIHDNIVEPLHGERVPYIVISNGTSTRLNDQVISPLMLLKRSGLRLDHHYYIDKQIVPALDRVFSLVGVNVRAWVNDIPRQLRSSIYSAFADSDSEAESDTAMVSSHILPPHPPNYGTSSGQLAHGNIEHPTTKRASTRTLDDFYLRRSCLLCKQIIAAIPPSPSRSNTTATAGHLPPGIRICEKCWLDGAAAAAQVGALYRDVGSAYKAAIDTCISCTGGHRADALQAAEACECVDCPVLFRRKSLYRRYQSWSKAASAYEQAMDSAQDVLVGTSKR